MLSCTQKKGVAVMRVNFEINAKKLGSWVWWSTVTIVLIIVVLSILNLLTSSDRAGSGMMLYFTRVVAQTHFYLWLIPITFVGFGMARDVKVGINIFFSFIRWLTAGLAIYCVALIVLINILLF